MLTGAGEQRTQSLIGVRASVGRLVELRYGTFIKHQSLVKVFNRENASGIELHARWKPHTGMADDQLETLFPDTFSYGTANSKHSTRPSTSSDPPHHLAKVQILRKALDEICDNVPGASRG